MWRDFWINLNLVNDNGQVRSFAELAGAALNFHKPGEIVHWKRAKKKRCAFF